MTDESPRASDQVPYGRGVQAGDEEAGAFPERIGDAPEGWDDPSEIDPTVTLPEVDRRPRTIAFDPHRRARSPDLKARIAAISAFLTAKEREIAGRSRRRTRDEQTKFDIAVEALACNLLTLSLVQADMRLSVPRDAGRLFGKGSSSQVYGRHFLVLLDLMAHPEVALIDQVIGRHGRDGGRTTVVALPALADRLPLGAVQWSDFRSAGAETEAAASGACWEAPPGPWPRHPESPGLWPS